MHGTGSHKVLQIAAAPCRSRALHTGFAHLPYGPLSLVCEGVRVIEDKAPGWCCPCKHQAQVALTSTQLHNA